MSRIVRSRAPVAFLRAIFVALLVALPQLLLQPEHTQATQLVALAALLAGGFTFVEYVAPAPSLVEFRDARPYNRIRATFMILGILAACLMFRPGWEAQPLHDLLHHLGEVWHDGLMPWTPVHLLVGSLPADADPHLVRSVQAAATAIYGLSLLMILTFLVVVRWLNWPGHGVFNVWVNLPQFDPMAGGDVVERLQHDARVNLALGLLLPMIAPMVADLLSAPFDGIALREPVALVWTLMLWAFLPASLAMRGLALHRLASLIASHRARLRQNDGFERLA
jgi:hypothetical protein